MKEKILILLKTKGYYIVLALCVLTVGTVSFLSYKINQQEKAEIPLDPGPASDVEKVEEKVPDTREESTKQEPSAEKQEQPSSTVEYDSPLSGEIIAHYSPDQPVYSYTLKDWRVHSGIDIAAPAGSQVKNVCDGVVESAETDDLMGNTVVVRHTDGKVSRYCSLGEIQVTVGQVLKKGEIIGTIGNSMLLECGEADHLHYELWADDRTMDPSSLLG